MDKRIPLLLEFYKILQSNKVDCWLLCGTLLGAYRDNKLTPGDITDIDLGIKLEDYWLVRGLIEKNGFKYKYIWRREFSIYKNDTDLPLHIDLYPIETVGDLSYCYSYKPNPKENNRWTYEWRFSFPTNSIFPLKTINFLNTEFQIPNNPPKWLESIYGADWKMPKEYKCTTYDICATKDLSHGQSDIVTAIVTTFKRLDCLNKMITSLRLYYPKLKLIIGNQGEDFNVTDSNTTTIKLPEDCGLSYARNELVKQVNTEYTLLLDDDFVFTEKTNIEKLLEIFLAESNIKLVGGYLEQNNIIKKYNRLFFPHKDFLVLADWDYLKEKNLVEYQKINNNTFGYADLVYNFFIAKTDILKRYGWDDRHKIHSEHLAFFLNLYKNNVVCTFTPNTIIKHEPFVSPDFKQYRDRKFYDLIFKVFGFKKGYCINENAIVNYEMNTKESLDNGKS